MVEPTYREGFITTLQTYGLEKSAGLIDKIFFSPTAGRIFGLGESAFRHGSKVITKPLSWFFKGTGKIMTGGPVNNKFLRTIGIKHLKPHPIIGGLAAVSPFVGGAMWLRNRNEKLQQVDTMTPIQEARWQRKTKGGYYDLGYDLEDSNDIPSLAY